MLVWEGRIATYCTVAAYVAAYVVDGGLEETSVAAAGKQCPFVLDEMVSQARCTRLRGLSPVLDLLVSPFVSFSLLTCAGYTRVLTFVLSKEVWWSLLK